MIKSPCQNCEDRYPACHDRCERYQEYRRGVDKMKEEKKKYYNEYSIYLKEQNTRIIRRKQQMGGSKFFK